VQKYEKTKEKPNLFELFRVPSKFGIAKSWSSDDIFTSDALFLHRFLLSLHHQTTIEYGKEPVKTSMSGW
jgi:hypothetical protein